VYLGIGHAKIHLDHCFRSEKISCPRSGGSPHAHCCVESCGNSWLVIVAQISAVAFILLYLDRRRQPLSATSDIGSVCDVVN